MRALPLLLLLAACGQPAPTPAPTATPTGNSFAAKVGALTPRLREGVLLRAVRDAGQDCQTISEERQVAPAAWLATCDGQHQWVVAIGGDGNATVTDAKDVAGNR